MRNLRGLWTGERTTLRILPCRARWALNTPAPPPRASLWWSALAIYGGLEGEEACSQNHWEGRILEAHEGGTSAQCLWLGEPHFITMLRLAVLLLLRDMDRNVKDEERKEGERCAIFIPSWGGFVCQDLVQVATRNASATHIDEDHTRTWER